MSRLTGADAYSLMEAYQAVYTPQELTEEQVWEEVESWVNSLLEEGYDLSDYTWEEMYESYLEEKEGIFNNDITRGISRAASGVGDYAKSLFNAQNRNRVGNIPPQEGTGRGAPGSGMALDPGRFDREKARLKNVGNPPAANQNQNQNQNQNRNRNLTATTPASPKVAPTKPAAAAQTGDKAKDMATFASTPANKGLAAAAAEKARIRGTQQTDNPLMKSMKSRLPMNSPSVQAPAVSNLGKGNQSLSQNPNAFKAAPPKPAATSTPAPTSAVKPVTPAAAVSAAPSNSAATSGSLAPATAKVATKPSSAMSQDSIRARRLNMEMEYDAYDLVLEYLLSEGHADTVEEAHYVMIEMDAETIGSIIEEEERRDPRGRVSSGPMNVYRKPEGKPSQAHLDAVAAHRESEKKKSPEQKKKELDDYIQRQRENK